MPSYTLHQRDVTQPWPLADGSVQCIVTSPPYWGLRDYGITGQLGLEPTPDEYVAKMVGVFREARRVLRDDGTLWLNLGDSYAGSWGAQSRDGSETGISATQIQAHPRQQARTGSSDRTPGLKPKDLIGIPWRVAFALQADGWYLRSDIIWSKPNPMPESITDRPTKAHEYLFLFTKRARYYYDAKAIAEESVVDGNGNERPARDAPIDMFRNRRTVWTITTEPYPEAHFATFPTALVEPCIKAGTSEAGCCAKCGKAWTRVVEKEIIYTHRRRGFGMNMDRNDGGISCNADRKSTTTGWSASCACASGAVPCTVLDPFAGSGTTLMVACRLGRDAVGLELNPSYIELARRRVTGDAPLLNREARDA